MSSIAIDRMCDVLNCFGEDRATVTFTEIRSRLELPKSSTFRLLELLVEKGLLVRAPDDRGYQLGYQLIRWGTLALSSLDLRNVALPILRSLSQACDETAFLVVPEGNAGVCLERVESRQSMRVSLRVGQRLYRHAGAASKVLLAYLPEREREPVLDEIDYLRLQPRTITDRMAMRAELGAVRSRGYAASWEEVDSGTMSIAAPVWDARERLTAAIGIEAPISRVPPEQERAVAMLVVQAAHQVSFHLGHVTRHEIDASADGPVEDGGAPAQSRA